MFSNTALLVLYSRPPSDSNTVFMLALFGSLQIMMCTRQNTASYVPINPLQTLQHYTECMQSCFYAQTIQATAVHHRRTLVLTKAA